MENKQIHLNKMEFISEPNINLNLNITNSKCYFELMNFIEKLVMENFFITPNEIFHKIITELWKDLDISEEYPIGFNQANLIDQTYVRKGGNYWLDAFNRPDENCVFDFESQKYIAVNCGIFTFKLVSIDDLDQSEIDDLDQSEINDLDQS